MGYINSGPERVRAATMTDVFLNPGITQSQITKKLGVDHSMVSRAVLALDKRGWLADPEVVGKAKHLYVTSNFGRALSVVERNLSSLPTNDRRLFSAGVMERREMLSLPEGTLERDLAHSSYLGRVALLGERHDLSESHDWFSGANGWLALVEIEAEIMGE